MTTEFQMYIMSGSYDLITHIGIYRLTVSALQSGQLSLAFLTSTVQLKSAGPYLDDYIMMNWPLTGCASKNLPQNLKKWKLILSQKRSSKTLWVVPRYWKQVGFWEKWSLLSCTKDSKQDTYHYWQITTTQLSNIYSFKLIVVHTY